MIMLKKLPLLFLLSAVLLVAAGALFHHFFIQSVDTPTGSGASVHDLEITPGMTLTQVAQVLADRGLIHSAFTFRLLARLQNQDGHIQAGEYRLRTGMTPREMLAVLTQGKVTLKRISIPEGFTLKQIAAAVETANLVNSTAFKKAATDPDILAQYQIPNSTAEGYLYPETYFFAPKTSAEAVVNAMLMLFESVFTDDMKKRAKEMGFSRHAVVTLASIVEKEAGNSEEYPIIASVFHNRLKKEMRLESDPTVIYGIGDDFDGNITRKHLTTPTPYNTYTISGMPPGPIASPSKGALGAVLHPADTDYFYFVSKNNGFHHFSKTYAEHRRMVRKYQLH